MLFISSDGNCCTIRGMERYHTDQNEYDYTDDTLHETDDVADVDFLIYDDGYVEQEPRWTKRRAVLFMLALVIIGAMVLVLVAPLLQNLNFSTPAYIPPLATPASQL